GPFRVGGMHPVAQGPTIHSPDPRRSPAALPVQNRSQGQQPTRLIGILRRARTLAQIRRPKPPLHRYRCPHDRPRINCHGGTESRRLLPGNPLRSRVRNSEVWYYPFSRPSVSLFDLAARFFADARVRLGHWPLSAKKRHLCPRALALPRCCWKEITSMRRFLSRRCARSLSPVC